MTVEYDGSVRYVIAPFQSSVSHDVLHEGFGWRDVP
jgi:hypothetical protein